MESLRLLQKRTLQQFLRTRPSLNPTRQLHTQPQYNARRTASGPRLPTRSLNTRSRSATLLSRSYISPFRRGARGYSTATEAPTQQLSLSQRLKKLSREYGWTALGVYLLLSALDFPFCFLAVRWLGTDRIGHWEHVVVSTVKDWVKLPFGKDTQDTIDDVVDGAVHEVAGVVQAKVPVDVVEGHDEQRVLEEDETYVVVDHGYNEASVANTGSNASIWTQLALAYAIHKSFIFIRVPLTAAILPKVVKTLRSWGYNIGKRPANIAGGSSAGTSGVNTKGSGINSS